MNKKVCIIGAAGMVGATIAYTLANSRSFSEIVLIDIDSKKLEGQYLDIRDSLGVSSVSIKIGSYSDISNDDIVVITAGISQLPNQSRLELLEKNAKIVADIVSKIKDHVEHATLLIVSNPVDVLTYVAFTESGFGVNQVFGTGTVLDTRRANLYVSKKLNIPVIDLSFPILGEHGDSSFLDIDRCVVQSTKFTESEHYSAQFVLDIEQHVRSCAYRIIDCKQSTYFGIAGVVYQILQSITSQDETILPLSVVCKNSYELTNTALSMYATLQHNGVNIKTDYEFSNNQFAKLHNSAQTIKKEIDNLKLK